MTEQSEQPISPALVSQINSIAQFLKWQKITIITEVIYLDPLVDNLGNANPSARLAEERYHFTGADGSTLGTTVVGPDGSVIPSTREEMRLHLQTSGLPTAMRQFSRALNAAGGNFYHEAFGSIHEVCDANEANFSA